MSDDKQTLVNTDWLADHLANEQVVVLDASWHLPNTGRKAHPEYLEQHIPGAVFFDIDAISDKTSPLPHMLPAAENFAKTMGEMGISNDSQIVVYDSYGLFSAARVWWNFKVMGHDNVAILNGGLPKWLAEDRPIESGEPPLRSPMQMTTKLDETRVRSRLDMIAALAAKSTQILDARPQARFEGKAPEPRPELPSGHMPGSLNLHYAALINEDGTLKSDKELGVLLAQANVDLEKPVITSCGSGVTAAILTLALTRLGHSDNALYDGSWTDWASHADSPIKTL